MTKNLINGGNIIIEEDNDNIKMNLSDTQRSWFTTTGGYAILEYTKTTD